MDNDKRQQQSQRASVCEREDSEDFGGRRTNAKRICKMKEREREQNEQNGSQKFLGILSRLNFQGG